MHTKNRGQKKLPLGVVHISNPRGRNLCPHNKGIFFNPCKTTPWIHISTLRVYICLPYGYIYLPYRNIFQPLYCLLGYLHLPYGYIYLPYGYTHLPMGIFFYPCKTTPWIHISTLWVDIWEYGNIFQPLSNCPLKLILCPITALINKNNMPFQALVK